MTVKRICIALGAALALAAIGWTVQGMVFKDKAGNMELRQLTGWRTTQVDENTLSFRASGNPFKGSWRDQGLTVTGKSIEGRAALDKNKALQLQSATIAGGVTLDVSKSDPNLGKSASNMTCTSLDFKGAENLVNLNGKVVAHSSWGTENQTFDFNAAAGTIYLNDPKAPSEFPFKKASFSGSVLMVYHGQRLQKQDIVKLELRCTADSILYDDNTKVVTLEGNVTVTGDDPLLGGDIRNVKRATIKLNAKRLPVEVDMSGEPGVTEFTDKSKKKGGGR